MASSRQLAAIMFTDIAGYTILMGDDEQKAFDILRKNRQLQRPVIEKYSGKLIKELGDGVVVFQQARMRYNVPAKSRIPATETMNLSYASEFIWVK